MKRLAVAGGHVLITEDAVKADISVSKAAWRFYQESKLLSVVLLLGLVALSLAAVFGYPPGARIIVLLGAAALVGWMILAFVINKIFRPHVTADGTIPRDAIKLIVYKEGGMIRRPSFAIVYLKDGEQKARDVFLFPSLFGNDAPLERVLPAFEEAGIETKPVDEIDTS
jgi:hypothetical protein